MKKYALSLSQLKDFMAVELKTFGDRYYPLHRNKTTNIEKSARLIKDSKLIVKNASKARAYRILTDIWTNNLPEVFVLCALAVIPSRLGTIKSETYIKELSEWWHGSPHPSALTQLLTNLHNILPDVPVQKQRMQLVPLKLGDLFEYLQKLYGCDNPVVMHCPYAGAPLPQIEMRKEEEVWAKIQFSPALCAHIVRHVRRSQQDLGGG